MKIRVNQEYTIGAYLRKLVEAQAGKLVHFDSRGEAGKEALTDEQYDYIAQEFCEAIKADLATKQPHDPCSWRDR